YTDRDSGRWVEKVIDYTLELRPHVVLEGTLRRPEVALGTAEQYSAAGFSTELHVVAVHEFVSRLRIFGRYLEQLDRDGHGRYTLPEAHRGVYENLPKAVGQIASAGVLDRLIVHDLQRRVVISLAP